MKKHKDWLPFDSRILPNIFDFKYPKNRWVRIMLMIEMVFALLVLIGTLVLVVLPQAKSYQPTAASSSR